MNLLLFLITFIPFTQSLPWDNLTVTIVVVEYQPIQNNSLSTADIISANIENYINLLRSVKDKNLGMIIFPESTLGNNRETSVKLNLQDNPCDSQNYPLFIHNISCAARQATTYIIINLVQKVACENSTQSKNCENYGHFFYNTDVVFDKNGTIVNWYHKYNLFGEHELDKPSTPDDVIIETDFGIKFGIFTCFDILFKSPPQDLLEQNVDAVVFPTMWFSEMPFLTAIQTQQMWAHAHNIKLFAAGANNPHLGSGGTGVYDGANGAVLANIIAKGGSEVYTYKYVKGVPSQPTPDPDVNALAKEMDGFYLKTDPSITKYNSTLLDVTKESVSEGVCYDDDENKICCNFTIKISTTTSNTKKNLYTYHMVAYSGIRSFDGVYNGGIEICGLIACLNSSLSSCGQRFSSYEEIDWPIKFEEIIIKANFENDDERTQFPNSLLSSIRPIRAEETSWVAKEVTIDEKSFTERTFSINEPQTRLLTFAIFGRNFAIDSPPNDGGNNSAAPIRVSWLLLFCFIILSYKWR